MEKKERELVRVYDKEGQHKTFAIPNEITCADVVVLFGKRVQGYQPAQFRLCVDVKGGMNLLLLFSVHIFTAHFYSQEFCQPTFISLLYCKGIGGRSS